MIDDLGAAGRKFRSGLARLRRAETPPHSQRWLELYARACGKRRDQRLAALSKRCSAFVFTKHFNMGGSHYAFTEGLSDAQSERHFVPGSSLCLLKFVDGKPSIRTLLHDADGVIRDPDVSYDGDRVLFAEYSGEDIELGGNEVLLVREDDILAILH